MYPLGVDISHHQGSPNMDAAKASGIQFCFHKATQGATYIDPKLQDNKQQALAAGLLWGLYHFGTGDDVTAQVTHFLQIAGDTKVLVLDFEKNTSGGLSMTLTQAEEFAQQIEQATGRWPILYTGNWLKDMNTESDILSKCPLWLAQYGPTPKLPLGFDTWTFWQYTDGSVGPTTIQGAVVPHIIDGIGRCDIDLFNGDAAALNTFWTGI